MAIPTATFPAADRQVLGVPEGGDSYLTTREQQLTMVATEWPPPAGPPRPEG